MAYKTYILIIYFISSIQFCFAQGIEFMEATNLSNAFIKARETGKFVFLDCYTEWCGPCKMMAKKEFVKEDAGSYFNPRFVCVKYDMEKNEGPELCKKYDIHAYPTFLFLTAEGEEIGRYVGAEDISSFISRTDSIVYREKGLTYYQERFVKGDRSNSFLTEYVTKLASLYQVKQITDILNDKSGDEIISDSILFSALSRIFLSFDYDNPLFLKLYNKRDLIESSYGKEYARGLDKVWVYELVKNSVEYDEKIVKNFDSVKFDNIVDFMKQNNVECVSELVLDAKRQIAFESNDCPRLYELIQGDMNSFSDELDHKLIPEFTCLANGYSDNQSAMSTIGKYIQTRIIQLKNNIDSEERIYDRDGKKVTMSELVISFYNDIQQIIESKK